MSLFSEFFNSRSPLLDILRILYTISLSGVVCIIFFVLKNLLRRLKYTKLPGPTYYFFDVLASFWMMPFTLKRRNGYSLQTFALQSSEALCRLYEKEKIVFVWAGTEPILLPNHPDAIQEIMSDNAFIEKPWVYKFFHPIMGEGLVTSVGSKWKPRRKMLNPSYHVSAISDFLPVFNEHGGKLVKQLQEGIDGEIRELFTPISVCVLDIICESILGVTFTAQEDKKKEFVHGLRRITRISAERLLQVFYWPEFIFRCSEKGREFYKILNNVHGFTHSVMKQKKKEYLNQGPTQQRKALMDTLIEFHMKNKNLTEEDIMDEIKTFTAASNESSVASLLFTLYLVGLDKEIQANAHQELDEIFGYDKEILVEKEDLNKLNYLECIIKESLRLFPTVAVIGREVPANKHLCGYKLPEGTSIAIIPYILHRDPAIYPDPERFDPSRFFPENAAKVSTYAYIPFAAGARNCIGQKFALAEMKIVLAHILRNFTVVSVDPRDKVVAALEFSLRTDFPIRFQLFSKT